MSKKILTDQPGVLLASLPELFKGLDPLQKYILTLAEARSLNLNDCFHGWCRFLASELGFEFEEIKYYFLIKNGHFTYGRVSLEKDKRRTKIPTSSSELNKTEFMAMLMSMEVFAGERGIKLPESEHKADNQIKMRL